MLQMLRAISCSICRVHRCILNAIMYFANFWCLSVIFFDSRSQWPRSAYLRGVSEFQIIAMSSLGWGCNFYQIIEIFKSPRMLRTTAKRVDLEKLIELETMMRSALALPTATQSVSRLEFPKCFLWKKIILFGHLCAGAGCQAVLTISLVTELAAAAGSCKL